MVPLMHSIGASFWSELWAGVVLGCDISLSSPDDPLEFCKSIVQL